MGRVRRWMTSPGSRFLFGFAGCLILLAGAFEGLRPLLVHGYMWPVSRAAALVLNLLGIPASLGETEPQVGVCPLAVHGVIYLVTFECTGIFALFLCLAAVLGFPVPLGHRVRGVLLVVPAFATYSAARLVVMGLVARFAPEQIELFHLYVMVLVNLGFVLLLWLYWARAAGGLPARGPS